MSEHTLTLRHPDRLFIGGEWVAPSTGRTIPVIASHDESTVYTVAEGVEADIERAVAAARTAFDEGPWPRLSHAERADWMRRIADAFEARSREFALTWTLESGVLFSAACERIGGAMARPFRIYADYAESFAWRERHRHISGMEAQLVREPVGTVAAIVPWNGPGPLMAQKCAPALIAGCTVVVKPSPEAPGAAYLFAEICEDIGLPAGVINVVMADRAASEALVRHPGIDKITFTGSTGAGRAIASASGERIARFTLELGGKSPAVVLDDYDLDAAAQTIAAGCSFLTGQVCHSLTRVIVHKERHDAMVAALAKAVGALKVGDPFDPASTVGPLATQRQREAVEGFIARAVEEGAQLAVGGTRPEGLDTGFYVTPTVFGNVRNDSTLGRQEVFGPVLAVIPAENEAHAIQLANDTIYGLNASVFTHDPEAFGRVAAQIRAGTVGHNASRTDATISFGGFKQSGLGREGGIEGLMSFIESKLIVLDRPYVD
ncbi:aldehyde dehydrogenase [Novosphingobium mangrovi (ex Hu et al. 2023)]|uniref:Aldehyde dehydrogenase n=1 Tax=Novosphingobium mangrovi (ex Hu et al. 2023) TaxID=2930094 RepID=A0ABT0AEJ5_9SPHN|nr:aldehyde dehydrogenase [Novosphingobium mangrovi (ex Hu et al. 2023)]MCJ1961602.1 aldehyde dehydrogenase [Novosphingobium mangrovi (ex Hu et al. 2023)]